MALKNGYVGISSVQLKEDDVNSLYLPKDNVCRTTHVLRSIESLAFGWTLFDVKSYA